MSKIISIHSFRGGTGKSNTTANLAAIYAQRGLRVGVVDTDIQSPGIHVIFGLEEERMVHSLNDYLWGKCEIQDAAHDVTPYLRASVPGKVYLIPSSIKPGEIARVLREGYDADLLSDGFQSVINSLKLDLLLIDTHPGLNEETLLSVAISEVLVIIMRPDSQDYQGTSVTVDIARKLGVPNLFLVVNKVPQQFDTNAVRTRVEQTYNCEVAAVLPHSDDMMSLASSGVFSMQFPDHPVTRLYKQLAERIIK
ncbi:MAG: MinD/ParA family protein [Longilinea sp.]|nr:MinD/ParA family protein [Longilinea sp.]